MIRVFSGIALGGILLLLAACDSANEPSEQEDRVTIFRDSFGVPHINGKSDGDTAFGMAYAQAEDNFWQIEDNFIRASGRLAEVIGEDGVLSDWINRALEIETLSRRDYDEAAPDIRTLLDGYASGLNHYLNTHPDVRPRLIKKFEPWQPLAFIRYLYFQNGFLNRLGLTADERMAALNALSGIEDGAIGKAALAEPDARLSILSTSLGSNSWAANGAMIENGNALLFINPHLPSFGPSQVYEAHVMSDDGWNFSGYTRFGFPLPYVGFGPQLGWASTDNRGDQEDAWIEHFDDAGAPLSYRYGEGWREATAWRETILVRTEDKLEERDIGFRKTHHGAVLGLRADNFISVRMAKFEEPGWLDQWYGMSRATDLDEFLKAASALDMQFGNYMYADQAGNILFVYNGAFPQRDPAFDWNQPVDGSDPATEWHGYHSISEIPQVLNPPSGWMQNTNSTPFMTSGEGDNPIPADFPQYMVRESDNARSRNARRILITESPFSLESWTAATYDTRVASADDLLPILVDAIGALGSRDSERAKALIDPMALLVGWDRVATRQSTATTLYIDWGEQFFARGRDQQPEAAITALEAAIAGLEANWGDWRVPWGDMNRRQRNHSGGDEPFCDDCFSIPSAGVPGWAGASYISASQRSDRWKRRYGIMGNSYVAVIEFGPKTVAHSLHVFGASADPKSPHFFDQAELTATGAYKRAWLYPEDASNNARRSYIPGQE